MRKYKIDGRYPSQYSFYNGARSRQLAGDLSPWCNSRNTGEPALAVWPCWKLNNTLSRPVLLWYPVSSLIPSLSSDTFDPQWLRSAEALSVTSDGFDSQWLGSTGQRRFRPPPTVSNHNGLTPDGLIPQHQRKRGRPPNGFTQKAKKKPQV